MIPALTSIAAPNVPESKEILLGMSTALSGPAKDLGMEMRDGVQAALDEANAAGGVHGKSLRLIVLNDGYEPERAAPNVKQLISKENVVAIIGNVGTPTAVAALPIANENKTPFVGAFSGAGVLRKKPPDRYVINYRASYAEEVAAMVDALIDYGGLLPQDIAFFTQRDTYGDAGFSGGVQALKQRGLSNTGAIPHARYERNTNSVEGALADLIALPQPPKAVIMVGAYEPCAAFIRLARSIRFTPAFLNVSFVDATSLARELGGDGDNVIVTQVVPHYDADLPLVSQYHSAISRHPSGAGPGFTSLEGYTVTRLLLKALDAIQGPITRDAIVDALEGLGAFDIGLGTPLALSPNEHQASHTVWPTILRQGRAVAFDWRELRTLLPKEGTN